mgnify:CR=1 FL=1
MGLDSLIAPADDGLASVQMGEGVVSKKGMADRKSVV